MVRGLKGEERPDDVIGDAGRVMETAIGQCAPSLGTGRPRSACRIEA